MDQLRTIDGLDKPWTADYDPLGRRTRKTYGETWTEYYWDTDRLAAEVHSSGRVRVYVYVDDFSLTPWLMIDYASVDAEPASGTLHYLVTDQRGAPVAALDASGERVWSAELAPYGLATVTGTLEVPFRLAGQLYDAETGLCYNRFRYYSPELGRYIEEDPAGTGGGVNVYVYACYPLVQFDALGLAICSICRGNHSTADHNPTKDARPRHIPSPHLRKSLRRTLRDEETLAATPGNTGIRTALDRRSVEKIGRAFVGEGYTVSRGPRGEFRLVSADGLRMFRAPTPESSEFARTGRQANFHQRQNPRAGWFDETSVSNVHVHVK